MAEDDYLTERQIQSELYEELVPYCEDILEDYPELSREGLIDVLKQIQIYLRGH